MSSEHPEPNGKPPCSSPFQLPHPKHTPALLFDGKNVTYWLDGLSAHFDRLQVTSDAIRLRECPHYTATPIWAKHADGVGALRARFKIYDWDQLNNPDDELEILENGCLITIPEQLYEYTLAHEVTVEEVLHKKADGERDDFVMGFLRRVPQDTIEILERACGTNAEFYEVSYDRIISATRMWTFERARKQMHEVRNPHRRFLAQIGSNEPPPDLHADAPQPGPEGQEQAGHVANPSLPIHQESGQITKIVEGAMEMLQADKDKEVVEKWVQRQAQESLEQRQKQTEQQTQQAREAQDRGKQREQTPVAAESAEAAAKAHEPTFSILHSTPSALANVEPIIPGADREIGEMVQAVRGLATENGKIADELKAIREQVAEIAANGAWKTFSE